MRIWIPFGFRGFNAVQVDWRQDNISIKQRNTDKKIRNSNTLVWKGAQHKIYLFLFVKNTDFRELSVRFVHMINDRAVLASNYKFLRFLLFRLCKCVG